MIWLFERGDRVARLVTRFDTGSGEYVLDMEWSDGLPTTERFSDLATFRARVQTLEQQLLAEEWKQADDSPQLSPRIGGSRSHDVCCRRVPPVPEPAETILLVKDEPAIRQVMAL